MDHDVPVLRVDTPEGKLRAVLFGYACHNTTLSFYKFCGDYAGFAQHYLEAAHPDVTALFLLGCGGDQNPYPRRTLELAQQHGRSLAIFLTEGILSCDCLNRAKVGEHHSSATEQDVFRFEVSVHNIVFVRVL